MLESRNLKLDLLALGLFALAVFLGASLLSYDPADPPSKLAYPERVETANLCGRSGATVSQMILGSFGLGAYYVLISLIVVDVVLLLRRPVSVPVLRLTGWILSLVGFCAFAASAVPGLAPGPVIGAGGYLGAAARGLLERSFAATGAYIVIASFLLSGLMLATDYFVFKVLAWTVGTPAKSLGRGAVAVSMAYASKVKRRRTDLDAPEEIVEDDEEDGEEEAEKPNRRTVRVRKPAAETSSQETADATSPEAKPAEADAAQPPAAPKIRKPKKKDSRDALIEQLEAGTRKDPADYELPSLELLMESEPFHFDEQEKDVRRKAKILEKTFADFGFNVRVVEVQTGPVIAQFEVELEAGLRLSKITSLADDLAIALRVPSVRIVAPIPGKNTVGIEVPNTERQLVRLREVMEEGAEHGKKMRIPIFLGKDVAGNPMIVDLTTLPHLLIAGRTGTGKSVCLNSIIVSMLMTRRPDEVRMLLIDPKMVELSFYKNIPHLMHPVVTDMRKAEAILGWAVEKMEERYQLLARAGVRHIGVYNQLGEEELMDRIQPVDDDERKLIPTHMPYIVIVADEMADLMMTAAKEVEQHIIRLAQKSRAVGIHLVLATQKPTVDVITGLIKSNLPARIAFQVASRVDSRVVLDEMGADKLLGNGDMLFLWPGTSCLLRGQGTYLSDEETNRVIESVATSEPQYVKELVQLKAADPAAETAAKTVSNRDELYDQAVEMIIREGRGSCSLLQRALGIGYGRAARLIDFMAEDGIVGAYNGSQARDVLITLEQWGEMRGQGDGSVPPALVRPAGQIVLEPASPRRKPIKPHDDEPEDELDDEAPFDEEEPEEVIDDASDEELDSASDAEDDDYEAELDDDASDEAEDDDRPPRRRWKKESA